MGECAISLHYKIGMLREMPKSMGDENCSLASSHASQFLKQLKLAFRIHGGRRLVDDEKSDLSGEDAHEST